jgi:hypothetical protein
LDPPVSETGTSDFAELGLADKLLHYASVKNQTVQFGKPEHLILLKNQIFHDSIRNLMLDVPNHLPMYFHP